MLHNLKRLTDSFGGYGRARKDKTQEKRDLVCALLHVEKEGWKDVDGADAAAYWGCFECDVTGSEQMSSALKFGAAGIDVARLGEVLAHFTTVTTGSEHDVGRGPCSVNGQELEWLVLEMSLTTLWNLGYDGKVFWRGSRKSLNTLREDELDVVVTNTFEQITSQDSGGIGAREFEVEGKTVKSVFFNVPYNRRTNSGVLPMATFRAGNTLFSIGSKVREMLVYSPQDAIWTSAAFTIDDGEGNVRPGGHPLLDVDAIVITNQLVCRALSGSIEVIGGANLEDGCVRGRCKMVVLGGAEWRILSLERSDAPMCSSMGGLVQQSEPKCRGVRINLAAYPLRQSTAPAGNRGVRRVVCYRDPLKILTRMSFFLDLTSVIYAVWAVTLALSSSLGIGARAIFAVEGLAEFANRLAVVVMWQGDWQNRLVGAACPLHWVLENRSEAGFGSASRRFVYQMEAFPGLVVYLVTLVEVSFGKFTPTNVLMFALGTTMGIVGRIGDFGWFLPGRRVTRSEIGKVMLSCIFLHIYGLIYQAVTGPGEIVSVLNTVGASLGILESGIALAVTLILYEVVRGNNSHGLEIGMVKWKLCRGAALMFDPEIGAVREYLNLSVFRKCDTGLAPELLGFEQYMSMDPPQTSARVLECLPGEGTKTLILHSKRAIHGTVNIAHKRGSRLFGSSCSANWNSGVTAAIECDNLLVPIMCEENRRRHSEIWVVVKVRMREVKAKGNEFLKIELKKWRGNSRNYRAVRYVRKEPNLVSMAQSRLTCKRGRDQEELQQLRFLYRSNRVKGR